MLKLIRTLRRFFAPEAAQEIWSTFRPKLLTLHPDFQEACCFHMISTCTPLEISSSLAGVRNRHQMKMFFKELSD